MITSYSWQIDIFDLYIGSGHAFDTKLCFLACSRGAATCLGTYFAVEYLPTRIPMFSWIISETYYHPQSTLRRHLTGTGRYEEALARTVFSALTDLPEDDELVGGIDFARPRTEKKKAKQLGLTRNYLWKRTINGVMLQFIQPSTVERPEYLLYVILFGIIV